MKTTPYSSMVCRKFKYLKQINRDTEKKLCDDIMEPACSGAEYQNSWCLWGLTWCWNRRTLSEIWQGFSPVLLHLVSHCLKQDAGTEGLWRMPLLKNSNIDLNHGCMQGERQYHMAEQSKAFPGTGGSPPHFSVMPFCRWNKTPEVHSLSPTVFLNPWEVKFPNERW